MPSMDAFLDVVLEVFGSPIGWRTWLCVVAALIIAYALSSYGILFSTSLISFIVAGVLGLVVGLFWDARTS
ncbi:MAG: hypothetical protein ACR2KT_15190 [Methylocella sp.]